MDSSRSIAALVEAVRRLPAGGAKEQWLAWLAEYHTPGYYNRQVDRTRDAKYAYNHLNSPGMLLWLIEAAGVDPEVVRSAQQAAEGDATKPTLSAAVRKRVPWSTVAEALWLD